MLQSFIGIGAQKCASSWLHDVLADHPQVAVPASKELDYFTARYEFGKRWYLQQLKAGPKKLATGEISPSYFHEPTAAVRARAFDPDFKVLVSLRNPVERALSQHRHLARLGLLPADDLCFESALASNPTYTEQGRYHEHLSRWIDLFGRERVHVILVDDIGDDPVAVARGLYSFLSVDTTHVSAALRRPSNPSYLLRSPGIGKTVARLRTAARATGLNSAWRRLGDAGLRSAYRKLNRKPSEAAIPQPLDETISALYQEFAPEVERLQALVGRDLSHWLPQKGGA